MELVHELIDPRAAYEHIEDDAVFEACVFGRRSQYILAHRQRSKLYSLSLDHQKKLAKDPAITTGERRQLQEATIHMRNNLHDPDMFLLWLRFFWLV